jgi:hypothetical protein
MSQVHSQRFLRTIGKVQIAIILLVALTALIHLQRGISMSFGGFGGAPSGRPGGFPGGPPGGFRGGPPGGFNIMQALPLPLSTLFLINGIGYLVLLIALYLPALYRFRWLVRWLLIGFAAVTFMLYFLVNGLRLDPIAILDKGAEIALIILLLIDARQSVHSTVDVVPR